jgi:hypothetical protein
MSAVMQQDVKQNLSVVLTMDEALQAQLRQGETAMSVAQEFVIDCAEMAQAAANERTDLAVRIDALQARRKKFIEPAQQIIDNAKELFNPAIANLTAAREYLGVGLIEWDKKEKARIAKEKEEREAEERRARQKADQEAAVARARAEEQAAEQRRLAAVAEEARQKALREGNARAAEAAAAAAAKATEKAEAAIEEGNAAATQAHVAVTAMAMPAPAAVKISGSSVRENWIAKLNQGLTEDDAKALIVNEAATNPQMLGLLELNTGAINKLAKALKGAMRVPGYTAKDEPTLAGSRK